MNLAYYLDLIDKTHQENHQHLKKLPYILPRLINDDTPNHMPFANQVERWTAAQLIHRGYRVELTPHTHPFDLWLDDRIRVEIKGAQPYYSQANRYHRYQAELRNHQTDLLIFICIADFDQNHAFIIPHTALGRRRNLVISSLDPRDYTGQWAPYLEDWTGIDRVLAGKDHVIRSKQYTLFPGK